MEDIKFTVKILASGEAIPPPQEVSAVFLITLKDNDIVAIRNHRGWDIPAGHVELGEGLLDALQREALEEASMRFKNAIPFAIVISTSEESKYQGKCMVGFATKDFTFEEFAPAPDSQERKVMDVEEFLSLHQSNKENMRLMITTARSLLYPSLKVGEAVNIQELDIRKHPRENLGCFDSEDQACYNEWHELLY